MTLQGGLIVLAVAAIISFASGYRVESWHAGVQLESALNKQKADITAQCEQDKQVTKGANDALQKQVDTIAGKLAAAKRLHLARCIVPHTSVSLPAASGGEHAGSNGISTDWLRDYAAECETYRQQRLTLEQFIVDAEALGKAQ